MYPQGAASAMGQSAQGDPPDVKLAPVGHWCWNELWTRDAAAAVRFYQGLIGYSLQTMDMGDGPYHMLGSQGEMRAGITTSVNPAAPSMWLPYVKVADCDASAAKARKLGGQVMFGPQDIPGTGRFSIVVDPLGAAVGIIKLAPMA